MASLAYRPHVSSSALGALLWAAAFAAGIALPSQPCRVWPIVVAAPAVLTALLRRRSILLVVAPLLLGSATTLAHRIADPLPALLGEWSRHGFRDGITPIEIEGRVLDTEEASLGRTALILRLRRYRIPGRPPFEGGGGRAIRIRVTAPAPTDGAETTPRPGDLVELTARVGRPRSFRNPGAFDYVSYLAARGIDLVGTVKSARLIRVMTEGGVSAGALTARARAAVIATLRRAAGAGIDEGTSAFLAALLIGTRDDLPPEFEERLVRSGVYHIVALSGFNVALIAGLASAFIRLLPLSPRPRRILLALCVILYWSVARSSGSIARAALMSLLALAGTLLGRRVPGAGALACASVLILGANPSWCGDPGFQLSVAATLGLLLIVPRASADPDGRGAPTSRGGALRLARLGVAAGLRASLWASAAALVSTALVSARHFQALTPVALLANLFAVPIAAILLVLGLFICSLEPLLPAAAGALFTVASSLIEALDWMAAAVASLGWASFPVLPPPVWIVLTGQCALVIAAWGRPALRRGAALLLALAIGLTAALGRDPRAGGRLEVVALDVGQGDALLVRFPGGPVMLVDAGGFARSQFDVGSKVVAPALRALGILNIDILAVTHAHRDHLGGAAAILRSFSPGAVWLGRMPPGDPAVRDLVTQATERGIGIVTPRRGTAIVMGGARVEVLNPGLGPGGAGPAGNDDSLVLRVSFEARGVLLTGDLEAPIEIMLAGEGRNLRADLLKVGHHGSRTSTTGTFLERVRPLLGVISVGAANPWGHPDAEVLERLRAGGVEIYRTDVDGAVRFTTDGATPWRALRLTEDREPLRGIAESAE